MGILNDLRQIESFVRKFFLHHFTKPALFIAMQTTESKSQAGERTLRNYRSFLAAGCRGTLASFIANEAAAKKQPAPKQYKGHYLLNPEHAAKGANRVDFEIVGEFVSVNSCAWRALEPHQFTELLRLANKQGALI